MKTAKYIDYIDDPNDSFDQYLEKAKAYDFRCVFADIDTFGHAKEVLKDTDIIIAGAVDFPDGVLGTEEKLELCRASRKIILPEGMEEQGKFSVLRHQIDTNHHVNNGQYVQMAEEFLPEGFCIRQMRAEYKKAAMLHDVIVPMACHQDGVCTVALCDEEKRPYASVEFTSFV